jgi:uncharacterized iron-regulated membrane protein
MRVRALALRLHLLVGVLTGAALLVLGLSGAVLVLRPDFESSPRAGLPPAPVGAPPPSLDAVLEVARRRHPGFLVTSLSLPGGGTAARVGMLDPAGGALDVVIDPRSGTIVSSSWAERSPLHALRLLHTELYLGARGRALVGILGLWLMLQGITGLYLWWPLMRRPRWGFTIRWARPWPVVGRDLHKALGAASLVFHLPIAATGALLGMVALPSGALDVGRAPARLAAAASLAPAARSLETLAREAEHAMPRATITAFRFLPDGLVAVTMRVPGELDPRGASFVLLQAAGGSVVSVSDARQAPWTARLWAGARALHVGAFGGFAARAFYVLGGIASVALAVSGYVLALARSHALGSP